MLLNCKFKLEMPPGCLKIAYKFKIMCIISPSYHTKTGDIFLEMHLEFPDFWKFPEKWHLYKKEKTSGMVRSHDATFISFSDLIPFCHPVNTCRDLSWQHEQLAAHRKNYVKQPPN